MLQFYVSTRPIKIDKYVYGPQDQLEEGFKGLDVQYTVVTQNRNLDGRELCSIVIGANSSYTDQECQDYKAIILEGLQAWSVHEKTIESAQALAEKLDGVSYEVVNGLLKQVVPQS